jgi:EAL domain-containing protein (putative c-di-GMP-specific phosphodiesterase class I)
VSHLTMAFHPIVDVETEKVWGYEALVRGTGGDTAVSLLGRVTDEKRARFDQACRLKAIEMAAQLFPEQGEARLTINFLPGAVTSPGSTIKTSLDAARRVGFDHRRIVFEFYDTKRVENSFEVQRVAEDFQRVGFQTAIDNFGTGYAGLSFVARFQPDLIKIDKDLVRGIAGTPAKQMVVAAIISMARGLGIKVAAEGVETESEMRVLKAAGIRLQQGYFFALPTLGMLPPICGLQTLTEPQFVQA